MCFINKLSIRALVSGLFLVLFYNFAYANGNRFSFRFADKTQACNILTVSDKYIQNLSNFDLDARVGKRNATREDLLCKIKQETRNFTKEEQDSIAKAFSILTDDINNKGLDLPLPDNILLIKTSMKEEGGAAAYTRGDVICVGEDFLKKIDSRRLAKLLAHELFHIMTRDNKDFRKAMYEIIGFKVLGNEIKFQNDITSRFISNPDVNNYDSYVMLNINGRTSPYTMIIYSNRDYSGGSFFDYVHIGLVPLNNVYAPETIGGSTVILSLDDVPDFYNKVGKNTGYVINPEECMADNFSIAICGSTKELPNPEIINNIICVIKKMYVD